MKKKYLILFLIIILAAFLRLWQLDVNPPGVHADEADSGYNAYSILKTGKDMYGNFLPIQITGFAQNYRAPLSTYLTIPFVAAFGLSPFVVRLPTAIFGTLLLLLIFFLVKILFKSEKLALITAFLVAVNPWAVHISRAYADHILALDFMLLGLIFFLKKERTLFYFLSGLFFGLSLFSYHAPKVFLPFFIPLLILIFWKDLSKKKANLLVFLAVFILFFSFVLKLSFFDKGAQEFNNVSAFNSRVAKDIVDKERRVTFAPLKISSIFHSKPLFFIKEFSRNYGRAVSINYLYLDGESNLTAWVGDRGLFYPIELPFFLIGIYSLFAKKKKTALFLLGWLITSVIPGAIAVDQMYTYRNIYLLPVILIFTSYGLLTAYKFFSARRRLVFYFVGFIGIFFTISIISYFYHYFYDYPFYSRSWWAAPDHEAIDYIITNKGKYNLVYINGGINWLLLFAFDTKLDPSLFQYTLSHPAKKNGSNFFKVDNIIFENFFFKKDDVPAKIFPKNSLYSGKANDFPLEEPVHRIISKDDWGTIYKMFEIK
ncbi:MAG: glycosyltransferase family 39 protein [Candidatus Levybacteria bacterium]|nr:glycosyltransferase family 39 protein [Candidatus Levybacteria bacterium]